MIKKTALMIIFLLVSFNFAAAFEISQTYRQESGYGKDLPLDYDFDGIDDRQDNCLFVYNPDQADSDFNELGDECDAMKIDVCQYKHNIDLNGNGISEYCEIPPTGTFHEILTNLYIDAKEQNSLEIFEVAESIRKAILQGEANVLPTGFILISHSPYSQVFFTKMKFAVSELTRLSIEQTYPNTYSENAKSLTEAIRALVALKTYEIKILRADPRTQFRLTDPSLDLSFAQKIDASEQLILEGNILLEQKNYFGAIEKYQESYSNLTQAFELVFTQVKKTVGPQGGIIKSLDGLFVLEIPAGALNRDVEIGVELSRLENLKWNWNEHGVPSSPVYKITGDVEFNVPATIKMASFSIPNEYVEYDSKVYFFDSEGNIIKDYPTEVGSNWLATIQISSLDTSNVIVADKIVARPNLIRDEYRIVAIPPLGSGLQNCFSLHGFTEGSFCTQLKYTESKKVPLTFEHPQFNPNPIKINKVSKKDIVSTKQALMLNRVKLEKISSSDVKAGWTMAIGGALFTIIGISIAAGGTPIILAACISGASLSCAITGVIAVFGDSQSFWVCKNYAVLDQDCNKRDTCSSLNQKEVTRFKNLNALDSYCLDNGLLVPWREYAPLPEGGIGWCADDITILNCRQRDGVPCGHFPINNQCTNQLRTIDKLEFWAPQSCVVGESEIFGGANRTYDIDITNRACSTSEIFPGQGGSYVSHNQVCNDGVQIITTRGFCTDVIENVVVGQRTLVNGEVLPLTEQRITNQLSFSPPSYESCSGMNNHLLKIIGRCVQNTPESCYTCAAISYGGGQISIDT